MEINPNWNKRFHRCKRINFICSYALISKEKVLKIAINQVSHKI